MEIDEIVKLVLLPFGGVSVVLVAMVGWLAHISTKRIVEGELAKQVDLATGSNYTSEGVLWHEVVNIGETTIRYLIVERKESSSQSACQQMQ